MNNISIKDLKEKEVTLSNGITQNEYELTFNDSQAASNPTINLSGEGKLRSLVRV